MNNDDLRKAVIHSGATSTIAALFLAGVTMQVALTAVNKAVAWILYAEADKHAHQKTENPLREREWYQCAADCMSEQCWIDLGAELATGVVFVIATLRVFQLV